MLIYSFYTFFINQDAWLLNYEMRAPKPIVACGSLEGLWHCYLLFLSPLERGGRHRVVASEGVCPCWPSTHPTLWPGATLHLELASCPAGYLKPALITNMAWEPIVSLSPFLLWQKRTQPAPLETCYDIEVRLRASEVCPTFRTLRV